MSDISEQQPNNTIEELSKALFSETGKEKRVRKHCSKIGTTSAENRDKSPSREINAEDDLKTTILNLSKPIREVKQERFSTSFQHYRFCSNPDLLRYRDTETELPKSYHRHSQSTKCLRSQLYTKYLLMNLHQMRIIAIFMTKKYIF